MPTYRDLWLRIRDDLPKKGRRQPMRRPASRSCPTELEGALHSLYGNYEKALRALGATPTPRRGGTPPVFIVVCNNTIVSKLVFD